MAPHPLLGGGCRAQVAACGKSGPVDGASRVESQRQKNRFRARAAGGASQVGWMMYTSELRTFSRIWMRISPSL
eukprot:4634003-Prymnesium_polylepis.1